MKNKNIYAADFETNNYENDCHVWAWGIENIYSENYEKGENIESFFEYLKKLKNNTIIYFHNEKFDGQFILDYILKNGFIYDPDCKNPPSFSTIIDDSLKFYEIKIKLENNKNKPIIIKFHDSMKKINMQIAQMPKAFGLNDEKGNLDETENGYNQFRPKGYKMTKAEEAYLYKDVNILSQSLKYLYDQGLDSMTVAGGAMKMFKKMISEDLFNELFPVLSYEEDEFVRGSYKGGYCYCPESTIVGKGNVYDVNSLYPSVLYSKTGDVEHLYPKGRGVYYIGKYRPDELYPLYVQKIKVDCHVKEGFLPSFLLKNTIFAKNEYLKDSNGIIEITLNNIDMDLFLKHYEIDYIEYIDGYKYRAVCGIFDGYIDKFMTMKIEAGKLGNPALKTLAKLYLNSLYGKFGMSKVLKSKKPYLDEDGVVCYQTIKYEINEKTYDYLIKDGYYIPVASFCTAYARQVTINAAQVCNEMGCFLYADTDSLHLLGDYIPNIPIDKYKLGYWDHESSFDEGIFIRQKTYAEKSNGKWEIKCAGMPEKMKDNLIKYIDDNELEMKDIFKIGFNSTDYNITGKLLQKNVKGGKILLENSFRIL